MQAAETIWKPEVTVAAVIERDGKFLLIEEQTTEGLRLNQPAGHLEADETLTAAVVRETLEESAHHFVPENLLGIYRHRQTAGVTYMRFAFCGRVTRHEPARALDDGIVRASWMSVEEIRASRAQHRSPLVLQCIDDYLAGARFPLDVVNRYVVPA